MDVIVFSKKNYVKKTGRGKVQIDPIGVIEKFCT